MRGGGLPPALLCTALGLALAFAPRRTLPHALSALAVAAMATGLVHPPAGWADTLFLALWASVVVSAASVHLPRGLGPATAIGLSVNAGVWTGLAIATAGKPWNLAEALPCSLVCIPARWAVARGWGVAIKVASSWLIAIALLAAGLSFVATPGYKPDHMD